jgi:hypothetical protein
MRERERERERERACLDALASAPSSSVSVVGKRPREHISKRRRRRCFSISSFLFPLCGRVHASGFMFL